MNKMREAFEKWAWAKDTIMGFEQAFNAGYAAAIAAVKEGGPYTIIPSDVTIGKGIPLYKLPEDK